MRRFLHTSKEGRHPQEINAMISSGNLKYFLNKIVTKVTNLLGELYLLESDTNKIKIMRQEFEEIREKIMQRMTISEDYIHGLELISSSDINARLRNVDLSDADGWRRLGEELKFEAQKSWRGYNSLSGTAKEKGVARAEALYLLSLQASSMGFTGTEAIALQTEIKAFVGEILHFMKTREGNIGTMLTD